VAKRDEPIKVETARISAVNAVQWFLYYPGILNIEELGLDSARIRHPGFVAGIRGGRFAWSMGGISTRPAASQ
jgi:hypothetical protein